MFRPAKTDGWRFFGLRPASFPKKYMKMWLSNVPDYTSGMLSNLVYLVPYLEDTPFAVMLWNCLRNQGSFGSFKGFCFNYSYLTSSGIKRYFNCLVLEENHPLSEGMALCVLPERTKPFSSFVSKKELHQYLSWILLRVLCCPRATLAPYKVDDPTNMVSFIRLLIAFCQQFPCPAHWLGEFAQNMANDAIVTNTMPFDGILPVKQMPPAAPRERKINLGSYQLEFETIFVTIKGALPFQLSYMPRYARPPIRSRHILFRSYPLLTSHPVQYNAGCLLFYKSNPKFHTSSFLRELTSKLSELIESKDGTIRGVKIQIMSVVDVIDFERCVASWRMREAWYERMKEEEWNMIVQVANRRQTVSRPVPASEWIQGTKDDIISTAPSENWAKFVCFTRYQSEKDSWATCNYAP